MGRDPSVGFEKNVLTDRDLDDLIFA